MSSDFDSWPILVWIQAWQIGVLGLLVGCANLLTARRWPHLAYALWLVVLAKCFVPPVGNWPVNIWAHWMPHISSLNTIGDR
jgi:hypothetical protein